MSEREIFKLLTVMIQYRTVQSLPRRSPPPYIYTNAHTLTHTNTLTHAQTHTHTHLHTLTHTQTHTHTHADTQYLSAKANPIYFMVSLSAKMSLFVFDFYSSLRTNSQTHILFPIFIFETLIQNRENLFSNISFWSKGSSKMQIFVVSSTIDSKKMYCISFFLNPVWYIFSLLERKNKEGSWIWLSWHSIILFVFISFAMQHDGQCVDKIGN